MIFNDFHHFWPSIGRTALLLALPHARSISRLPIVRFSVAKHTRLAGERLEVKKFEVIFTTSERLFEEQIELL